MVMSAVRRGVRALTGNVSDPPGIIERVYGSSGRFGSHAGLVRKGRDVTMLSRRQRIWDETVRDLGIDPSCIEKAADPAAAIACWTRIARHLEARGLDAEAAEAWDWAVSEALEEGSFEPPQERVLWEASEFYERHDALGSLRSTLEQAWESTRHAPGGVSAGFAARLLSRLSAVYTRSRMPDRAAEAAARAQAIEQLAPSRRPSPARRCA
jgi:hypothetical protein